MFGSFWAIICFNYTAWRLGVVAWYIKFPPTKTGIHFNLVSPCVVNRVVIKVYSRSPIKPLLRRSAISNILVVVFEKGNFQSIKYFMHTM